MLIISQLIYGVPAYSEKYTSEPSATIQGRAPVASNLTFDNPMPAIGDTVTLNYDFYDADGDIEMGSAVQWFRDGEPIDGATTLNYTLSQISGDKPGQQLRAEVTPKTNPNRSDPAVGRIESLEVIVAGDVSAAPQVKVTDITGLLQVGKTLTGVYTYDHNGSGSGDNSTTTWLNGGHASNDISYALDASDVGKVLTFEVEAKNLLGTVGNTDRLSTANAQSVNGGNADGSVIDANATPSVENLAISGMLVVGETLSATYTFKANGGENTDHSTYAWGVKDSTASTVASGATVTASGTVPDYTIMAGDAGSVLEVSVQAKNKIALPQIGNTLTVDTVGLNGNTSGQVTGHPRIKDLAITSASLNVGDDLTATYAIASGMTAAEDRSTYTWKRGATSLDTGSSTGSSTSGTVPAYRIVPADVGQTLSVSVEAKSSTVATGGNTLTVSASTITNSPRIKDLAITSASLNVGDDLTATYAIASGMTAAEDRSTYTWKRGATSLDTGSSTGSSTSGTVPAYRIVPADVGQTLSVSVEAKSSTVATGGNTLTVSASTITNSPRIKDLAITSASLNVGDDLTATYAIASGMTAAEDRSHFELKHGATLRMSGDITGSTGSLPSGTVPAYRIVPADVGQTLILSLQAKNNAITPAIGNTLTASASTITNSPRIKDLAIVPGSLNVGDDLRATYAIASGMTAAEDRSTYTWKRGATSLDTGSSTGSSTSGTVPAYRIVPADVGQTLSVSVEAKSSTVATGGNTLTVSASTITNSPRIKDLAITSASLNVGDDLTATYAIASGMTAAEDRSTYTWKRGATSLDTGSSTGSSTSGTVPAYRIVPADVGQTLSVSVEAKSSTVATGGNTLTVSASTITNSPRIKDLAITSASLNVGDDLTATYAIASGMTAAEDRSHFELKHGATLRMSGDITGSTGSLPSGTVPAYRIVPADVGQTLILSLQAKNNAITPAIGNTLTASASTITNSPRIKDLAIVPGSLNVGDDLRATYAIASGMTAAEDRSTYTWKRGATSLDTGSSTGSSTSGTVPAYRIVPADVGQTLSVSVEAKSSTVATGGNTLTVSASTITNSPRIKDLAITSASLNVGDDLTATYAIASGMTAAEDRSTYTWKRGATSLDTGSSTGSSTSGTVPAYRIVPADVGQTLSVSVEAKSSTVATGGNTLTVSASTITNSPRIKDLAITSASLNVGDDLTATYAIASGMTAAEDRSTYTWKRGATSLDTGSSTGSSTSGTVPAYRIVPADVGQTLSVSVEAKSSTVATGGNTLTVSASTITNSPRIKDLAITSASLNVGDDLTATYAIASGMTAAEDRSHFELKHGATLRMSGDITGSTGSLPSGTVPAYRIVPADVGQTLILSLQAKNNAITPAIGNTLTASASTITNSPRIKDLAIVPGSLNVGDDLRATYAIASGMTAAEDRSTYTWKRGATSLDTGSSTGSSTSGTVPAYRIVPADVGQTLSVSVEAKSSTVATGGNTLTVSASTITNSPRIKDLAITSASLNVGDDLTATYAIASGMTAAEDRSTYTWKRGATSLDTGSSTGSSTSGTVPAYRIVPADVGQTLSVSVEAKSSTVATGGNTLTVSASTITNSPRIKDLAITSASLNVGDDLTATYAIASGMTAAEDRSHFELKHGATLRMSGDITGSTGSLPSGTVPAYRIVPADVGQTLILSLQAKNNAITPAIGNTLTASASTITNSPRIKDLAIVPGSLNVGDDLRATYAIASGMTAAEDRSTYTWKRGATSLDTGSSTGSSTSGTVPAYRIVPADVGQTLSVSVEAKSSTVATGGNTLTAITSRAVAPAEIPTARGDFFMLSGYAIWSDAKAACVSAGARLPTNLELQYLFVSKTSATIADGTQSNVELYTTYGWDVESRNFWSSTYSAGTTYFVVDLQSGYTQGSIGWNNKSVACIR
ncbi:hypothetical protein EY04_27540 [Pseudomonas chlororaphis]|nr:hypothetical protein EY04_27540 [Pseudomonas chlororaphis]